MEAAKALPARVGRPPGANSEETRIRVLHSARSSFAERGYGASTNAEIARRAGVTAAMIYRYFGSKADLYLAVLRDAQSQMLPLFAEAARPETTIQVKIREIFRVSAELHDQDPSLTLFLASIPIELRRHDELGALLEVEPDPTIDQLTTIFDEGIRRGELAEGVSATNLVGMVLGCAMGLGLFTLAFTGSNMSDRVELFTALMAGTLFTDET